MDFLEFCRQIIAVDSSPSQGTLEVARFVSEYVKKFGFYAEIKEEIAGGVSNANLIVHADRPSSFSHKGSLALISRIDTCEPGELGLWHETQSNPFCASIYGDKIVGLGAASGKLDFACKLWAMNWLSKKKIAASNCLLVGTYGHNQGGNGALRLLRRKLIASRSALIGAPTQLKPMLSGLGIGAVNINIPFSDEEVEFRREHNLKETTMTQTKIFLAKQSKSNGGSLNGNPIFDMLNYLSQLPDGIAVMEMDGGLESNTTPNSAMLEFEIAGDLNSTVSKKISTILSAISDLERERELLTFDKGRQGSPIINLGMIRTYEDHIVISGGGFLPPSIPNDTYLAWIAKLQAVCQKIGASIQLVDYKPSFALVSSDPLAQRTQVVLDKLGVDTVGEYIDVNHEANVLSRFGMNCLVIGPGDREVSEGPNEFVELKQLEVAKEFYKQMLEQYHL